MARTPDFEDKMSLDWPDELRQLFRAAASAYSTMGELDELLTGKKDYPERAPYIMLADAAYKLLRDIRAEGERRLAAWEESVRGNEGE